MTNGPHHHFMHITDKHHKPSTIDKTQTKYKIKLITRLQLSIKLVAAAAQRVRVPGPGGCSEAICHLPFGIWRLLLCS